MYIRSINIFSICLYFSIKFASDAAVLKYRGKSLFTSLKKVAVLYDDNEVYKPEEIFSGKLDKKFVNKSLISTKRILKNAWMKVTIANFSETEEILITDKVNGYCFFYSSDGSKIENLESSGYKNFLLKNMVKEFFRNRYLILVPIGQEKTFYINVKNGTSDFFIVYFSEPSKYFFTKIQYEEIFKKERDFGRLYLGLIFTAFAYFRRKLICLYGIYIFLEILTSNATNEEYVFRIFLNTLQIIFFNLFLREIMKSLFSKTKKHLRILFYSNIALIIVFIFDALYHKFYNLTITSTDIFGLFYMSSCLFTLAYFNYEIFKEKRELRVNVIVIVLFELFQRFKHLIFITFLNHRYSTDLNSVIFSKATDLAIFGLVIFDHYLEKRKREKIKSENTAKFLSDLSESGDFKSVLQTMIVGLKEYFTFSDAYVVTFSEKTRHQLLSSIKDINSKFNFTHKEIVQILKDNKNKLMKPFHFNSLDEGFLVKLNISEFDGWILFVSDREIEYNDYKKEVVADFSNKISLVLNHFIKVKAIHEQDKSMQIFENMKAFQTSTTHEVRIPLITLSETLQYVKSIYTIRNKIPDVDIVEYLDDMKKAIDNSLNQLDENLAMVGSEKMISFDILYISDMLTTLKRYAAFMNIKVDEVFNIPKETKLFGPEKAVKNIVVMIMKNAIEALENFDRADKHIQITYYKNKKNFGIKFWDNGKGIKEEDLSRMFSLFSSNTLKKGMGQGLLLCQAIARHFGGDITLKSTENVETYVDCTLDILEKESNA